MTMNTRQRRAFWGDVRFFIGIALVVVSVSGVWLIVSSSRQTIPVLQSVRTILPGEALTSRDFQVADVNLGVAAESYLGPQDLVPGLIATRTLASGELVPSAATGDAESSRTTTVVIDSASGIPAGIRPGTVVEIWHAPPATEGKGFGAPRILVADVVVASLPSDEGMLGRQDASIEVVIDRADVADVLAAITQGSAMSVVPLGSGS